MLIKHVAFFAYPVSDIPRARSFYEGVLGLRLAQNFRDEWLEYDVAGTTFALTTMVPDRTPGAHGGFLALEVDDLDSWATHLKAKGTPFLLDLTDTPVCRMLVVADPDGNGVTLHARKPGSGS